MADQEQAYTPVSGCLARLFWLVGGNAMLALALLQILFTQPPIFSLVDAFYGSIVVLILVARYVDIRYFHGATGEGKPSTMADWRRHASIEVGAAAVAWCAAHAAVYFSRGSN